MTYRYLTIFILGIFLISLASATYYANLNQTTTVWFTCIDETSGNVCPGSTVCNMSVANPSGDIVGKGAGTMSDGKFYYIIEGSNLSIDGTHEVHTHCANGNATTTGIEEVVVDYAINKVDTGQGLLYFMMLIIMLLLFGLSMWGSVKVPWRNDRNQYDEIIRINWKKYLKMACVSMSYLILVWITFLGWNLSHNYLDMQGLGTFFKYFYYIFVGMALPAFATMAIFFAISFINDKKIQAYIDKQISYTR